MARPIEVLKLIVRGEVKAAIDAFKKLGTQAKSVGSRLSRGFESAKKSIFSLRGAIATIGVAALFRSIVSATAEAERATAQLDAVLKSTAGAAGLSREQILGMASNLQKLTTFGDEAIVGMQSLLATFKNVRGDNFERATELILDMSTVMGQDLKQSAIQVGKALQDPIRGVAALREVGVTLEPVQERLVRQMVEMGDVAGAQAIIMDELASEFGGSARAARQTFGGAIAGLKNSLRDLIEGDGAGLEGARQSVEDLTERLQDPSVVAALNGLATLLIETAGAAASLAGAVADVGQGIGILTARTLSGAEDADDNLAIIDAAIKRNAKELFTAQNVWDSFWQHLPNQQGYDEALEQLERLRNEQRLLAEARPHVLRESQATPVAVPPSSTAPDEPDAPASTPTPIDEDAAKAAEKRRQQIADMVASLREEADTHGQTAGEVALYRLEQIGATEADLERARGLVELIDAKEQAAAEARDLERAQADEQRLAEQQAEAQARFVESVRQTLDPTRALRQELERLNEVKAAGLLMDDEFAEAEKRLQDEIRKAGEAAEETLSTFRDEAQRNTQSIIADGLETALTDGVERGAEGALKAFADMLLQMALQAKAAKIAEKLFDFEGDGSDGGGSGAGFFANVVSALFAHQGGVAGDRFAPTRIAPASIFGDARRYHFGGTAGLGLSSDEVPAILQKGERVLNLEETRDYERGSGRYAVEVHVHANEPQKFKESPDQIGAAAANAMLRAQNRNS
jgi:phage-related minor tail protein